MTYHINHISILGLLFTLALSLGLTSCRQWILEDRMDCPTFVFVSLSSDSIDMPKEYDVHIDIHDKTNKSTFVRDTVSVKQLSESGYYLEIKKQEFINVEGIAGFNDLTRDGEQWIIPKGSNGVPYYWFKASAVATDERTDISAKFTKEYSRFNIQFVLEAMDFPYAMTVKSNTCGIDISTGDPIQGAFLYESPEGRRPGSFSFIAPRQKDNSLRLLLHRKPDETKAGQTVEDPAEIISDIYIWDLLKNIKGFSWDMENLVDVDIEIDYVQSTVTLSVVDWDSEETYSFTM